MKRRLGDDDDCGQSARFWNRAVVVFGRSRMTVRVLTGDVFDRLSQLPDESVHCVVTSPPYWGLRSYGTEPQVWGGDEACAHDWGAIERGKRKDMKPADQTRSAGRSGTTASQDGAAHNGGQFCSSCGAWRGELGMEPTLGLWLEHCVEVFREVRRVLRKDGTLWMNVGDAYATGANGRSAADTKAAGNDDRSFRDKPFSTVGDGLKPKDLMMMPARLVLALQADGWWLRSMLPWLKRNPMLESTRDRPTSAIEYVFLLTRAERYFYDGEAVKTAYAESSVQRLSQPTFETQTGGPKDKKTGNRSHRKVLENIHNRVPAGWASSETYQDQDPRYAKRKQPRGLTPRHEGHVNHTKLDETGRGATAAMRNTRLFYQSLEAPHGMICSDDGPLAFDVATAPFHEAHFATFPTALVEPCIKAGTSERGCCPECGAPVIRIIRRIDQGWDGSKYGERVVAASGGAINGGTAKSTLGSSNGKLVGQSETSGWEPTCECGVGGPIPCTVLDPFAGTVGLVADRLGRDAILIELNPEYADMARNRIADDAGMFTEVAAE